MSRYIRRQPFAALVTGVLISTAAAACSAPGDTLRLGRQLAPFERLPYVQAVDSAGATVLWRAEVAVRDSFLYRLPSDSGWRTVPVELGDTIRHVDHPVAADRRVRLDRLPASTEVEYRVYVADSLAGPYRFRTAPGSEEQARIEVLAFGDSGWGSEAQLVLSTLMTRQPWDLAIHTGDLAYDDGTEEDFTVRHFNVYRNLFSEVPLFPSAGDHDVRTRRGEPYDRAFEWPNPQENGRYYAFRWGRAQFISLATADESPVGLRLRDGRGAQLPWLRRLLAESAADTTLDWTIVYTHAPLYSSATGLGGHGSDTELRDRLEPLFLLYGVDLVLSGHDHHYQRSHPVRRGRRVTPGCGPVYIVTGGGGASRFARDVAPASWSARQSRAHHYVRLVIDGEELQGETIGANGQSLDSFRIWSFAGGEEEPGPWCRH